MLEAFCPTFDFASCSTRDWPLGIEITSPVITHWLNKRGEWTEPKLPTCSSIVLTGICSSAYAASPAYNGYSLLRTYAIGSLQQRADCFLQIRWPVRCSLPPAHGLYCGCLNKNGFEIKILLAIEPESRRWRATILVQPNFVSPRYTSRHRGLVLRSCRVESQMQYDLTSFSDMIFCEANLCLCLGMTKMRRWGLMDLQVPW